MLLYKVGFPFLRNPTSYSNMPEWSLTQIPTINNHQQRSNPFLHFKVKVKFRNRKTELIFLFVYHNQHRGNNTSFSTRFTLPLLFGRVVLRGVLNLAFITLYFVFENLFFSVI